MVRTFEPYLQSHVRQRLKIMQRMLNNIFYLLDNIYYSSPIIKQIK